MSLSLFSAVQIVVATQVGAPAAVTGVVWDGATGAPLSGAVVTLPDLNRDTVSAGDGRYMLRDVPAGPQHLVVRLIGYAPRTLQVLVPQDGEVEINVSLNPEPVRLAPIEIRPPVSVRGLESGDTTAAPDPWTSRAAMWSDPLLAEPDAFQALGGGEVAMRPESPSGINIRGGASDQTAYLLDRIPVFSPYHAAGLFSAWNPDALSQSQLSAAFPAPGNPATLSGTVSAATRTPGPRIETRGGVSTTQARLTVDGPLGGTGASFLLSARWGLPGLVAGDDPTYLQGETQDWLAKLEAPAFGGQVRLLGYDNQNAINAAAQWNGVGPRRNVFQWQSRSIGVEWWRVFSHFALRLQGWSAVGQAGSEWTAQSGPLELSTARRDIGFLAALEHHATNAVSVLGVRAEQSRTSYHVVSDSGLPIWNQSASTPVLTLFGQYERSLGRRTTIELGASLAASGGNVFLGPRAELRWQPSPRLTLSGSYARMHQFAQSLRNAESVVGNIFPADLYLGAGAPGVPVAQSDQGIVALDYHPGSGVRLGAQAYARAFDGLVLVAPSEGEPFTTGGFTVGSGTARGIAINAAVRAQRVGLTASYGLQQVRLRYAGSSYIPDLGATHQIEGGVIVFPTRTSSIRLGASAQLGRRTTTIASGFEWEACNLLDQGCEFAGSPHYAGEPLGATELPAYIRVDLGLRQNWHFAVDGRQVEMGVFGTITNLLGRTNLLTYARNPAGRPVGVEMRPLSPLVVGLDWSF